MKTAASVFLCVLALLQAAAAQVPSSDALQLFNSSGSQCAELTGELRKREAELEKQASRLENERDAASEEDGDAPDSADVVKEVEAVDPELQEIEEELARLTELAAANQGKPMYKNLMDSIQHLNFQRQKLTGPKLHEETSRQNREIEVANKKIADVNARIEAYNALSRRFEEDVSRFRASCSAR